MKCKRNIKNENFSIAQDIQEMSSSRNYIHTHNDDFRVLLSEEIQAKKRKKTSLKFTYQHIALTKRSSRTTKTYLNVNNIAKTIFLTIHNLFDDTIDWNCHTVSRRVQTFCNVHAFCKCNSIDKAIDLNSHVNITTSSHNHEWIIKFRTCRTSRRYLKSIIRRTQFFWWYNRLENNSASWRVQRFSNIISFDETTDSKTIMFASRFYYHFVLLIV